MAQLAPSIDSWRPWAGWLGTVSALLTAVVIACGPGSTLAPADDETDPPKLLLLRNGSVVEGTILLSGDDYLVKLPKGNILVPRQMVRLACRDLQEAYRALHDRAALQGEGEAYLSLARWCLTQKLFDEATFELQTALDLEPGLEEARQLMTRTAELKRDHARNALNAGVVVPEPAREKSETEAEALGGLSPELASTFARRIQPLLVNNCASTGCHGPRSESGFRLQRVTSQGGPNRLAADRNLASVLKQLNVQKPADSPLLLTPRGNHGRRGKPIFGGVTGKEQYAELKNWTLAVAKEEVVQARARKEASSPSQPEPPTIQLLEGSRPQGTDTEDREAVPGLGTVVPALGTEVADQVDPFDAPPARLASLEPDRSTERTSPTEPTSPSRRNAGAAGKSTATESRSSPPASLQPRGSGASEGKSAPRGKPPAGKSPAPASGRTKSNSRASTSSPSARGAASDPGSTNGTGVAGDLTDDPFDPQEFNRRRPGS